MKIVAAKAAVDKELEKYENSPAWQVKGTEGGKDISFSCANGLIPPQELRV